MATAHKHTHREHEGEALIDAARRNVTLTDDWLAPRLAERLRALRLRLDVTDADAMLAGEIA
mgnify:CR=1 FL=1